MRKLVVIGSINMDVVSNVNQFPQPGETIHSSGTSFFPGGKGANQAVAAASAGADCAMLGAVGLDPFGDTLIASLEDRQVRVKSVLSKEGTSGIAMITVNKEGENYIVLSEGANGRLTEEDVASEVNWDGVYAVLLQNEIPWQTTRYVIHSASKAGVRVWLNPAPARSIPEEVFPLLDTLIVNETEAGVVSSLRVDDAASAEMAADWIIAKGTSSVIITLGEQGCFYGNARGERVAVPAYRVKPVDTTAAGDTFIGAYAAACTDGMETEEALKFATAAAALTVTRPGAQSSIPTKDEILAFMDK
ncbi:ribokinase [Paenibacillus glucanolyticus]|uniref:Ribokinase n=1 Tax=Paenibacillus glucanolyticus TaxID=59843 RepID=A0A163EL46_9BACL|nr:MULTISPECIES: ribokinase [Paenibacillus]KZS43859.1 ribokinase [Paenibacillus glucanolyticus]MDH6669648.1 ribokinase [Paenibacillus sp. LBL]